jgi:hypothetical protein
MSEEDSDMTFTTIGRIETRQIREIAERALTDAFAATNLSVKGGHASFDPTAGFATIKFEFSLKNADGTIETKEAKDFRQYAHMFGLAPEDLGRTFDSRGNRFTITGLKLASAIFPILAVNQSGKGYKFPADDVKRFLAKIQ